jgi:hypothetical protein
MREKRKRDPFPREGIARALLCNRGASAARLSVIVSSMVMNGQTQHIQKELVVNRFFLQSPWIYVSMIFFFSSLLYGPYWVEVVELEVV